MLTLLSPAKKLLAFKHPAPQSTTRPVFHQKTNQLMTELKKLTEADIARLMHLSPALARLNHQRFQNFKDRDCDENLSYPAVLLFQGDVYQNLKAASWGDETLQFAEKHLAILSGLYGLLSPCDRIQPYRLEMGTPLVNEAGKNLYDFWQKAVTEEISRRLDSHSCPCLINLASAEYFKAVNTKNLGVPVIHVHFLEKKNEQLKVIGIHAKKARGAMARFIMESQADTPEQLKSFDGLHYRYCEKTGDQYNFNFIRST